MAMTRIPRKWLDYLKGLVRTGVPIGVAALVAWLRQRGVEIPEWGGTLAIPALTGLGYWALVRAAEIKLSPRWGVLLLAIGGPVYETAKQALDPTTRPQLLEVPIGPDELGVIPPDYSPNDNDPDAPTEPGEIPDWALPDD